jgi:ATPase subunit of ABC transporter with duplicated ATPase domains
MGTLPKPLIGLLLGTVAFFAIWMVALKPHSSSSGGSQGGVGQYQSAINQAHQAVTTSNQANAKLGAPTATTSASAPTATTSASAPTATTSATTPAATTKAATKAATKPATTSVTKAKPTAKAKAVPATKATAQSESAAAATAAQTVAAAIKAGKVVAILFYNDAAADDRAMKTELAAIPTHGGQVVKAAVPVSQLIQFSSLTQTVDVNTAPELVLIDHSRQASTLVGYADSVEIAQRIDNALATK